VFGILESHSEIPYLEGIVKIGRCSGGSFCIRKDEIMEQLGRMYAQDGYDEDTIVEAATLCARFYHNGNTVKEIAAYTVIVKDMSRLGREYLKVGYYTESYFPEHNVRFIAINDNVDCQNGPSDMDDFVPIKNIMNELYAKDISRKVRSAHKTRGTAGEPLAQPPYGYIKNPMNKKEWIIDPEASRVVKEIFKLYLEGDGIDVIAGKMQNEGHLNCTAYWHEKGVNRGGKKTQPNPYKWKGSTIYGILTRQEYCGDVINFKTYSKSFKNHKRYDTPKEDWLIFEDVHEPIIDRETFEKVQEMLSHCKRRTPKKENGPRSIYSDLLFCADCGSKLWYKTNTKNKDIHYFCCSNNNTDYRGTCKTRHYIRADAVETIVEMELRRLAEFLLDDADRFVEILARKSNTEQETERKTAQAELRKSEMRLEMIPKLLKNLYEDKICGKATEDDYNILSAEYSSERDTLKKKVLALRKKLGDMDNIASQREQFIGAIRKFIQMRTITRQLINELIDHIDVYETEGIGKSRVQRVVIYYKFVGYLDIPEVSETRFTEDIRQGVAVEYVSDIPERAIESNSFKGAQHRAG